MSIYATLWAIQIQDPASSFTSPRWVKVTAQAVPPHIGSPTPGCGYEEGDPYGEFLPPPVATNEDGEAEYNRAVVFVTDETRKGIGDKFLSFLEAAETDANFRAEIPAFVAEIKTIFERWQLAQYVETALQTEPFDATVYEGEDPQEIEMTARDDIRRCTRDLLLLERARAWLLED